MSDVLDKDAVLTHFGGDGQLVQEIAGIFLQSTEEWMAQLRAALGRSDADQVRRIAHTLKGSASNFLAKDVSAAAYRLEAVGKSGDLTDAPAALAALELQVNELRAALGELVRELGPAS